MNPAGPPLSGSTRQYPQLPEASTSAERPVSFVVVRFSDDYLHNFQRSECIHDPINEVIEVDNRGNLQFDNLTTAMAHGIRQARHDLICVIHEDVLLVPGWQSRFERSLSALEQVDANWGLVGSAGCDHEGRYHGHWSDPYTYQNDFAQLEQPFMAVEYLDEQILVFHRQRLPRLDEHQPGIHLIGRHLSRQLLRPGLSTYAIDAPTVHKYADQSGSLIQSPGQSGKIADRKRLTYRADMQTCIDYYNRKWPEYRLPDTVAPLTLPASMDTLQLAALDRPIIALARGGSGSRLASTLLQDAGVFLGNDLNVSGDSLEMVLPIYQGIIEKYQCHALWQKQQIVPRLRAAAAHMLGSCAPGRPWGFKLPESLLLLPELQEAFPYARYLHLLRDPLATCLRRSHMTARLDNHIGRIALRLAYDAIGRDRSLALTDDSPVRMACTTIHQLEQVAELFGGLETERVLELRFEDLVQEPQATLQDLCTWLGVAAVGNRIAATVDPVRASDTDTSIPTETTAQIRELLRPLRSRYGYET